MKTTLKVMTMCSGISWFTATAGDLTVPTGPLPETAPRLASVMVDNSGSPITTLADWQRHRGELLEQWRKLLGGRFPTAKAALKTELLGTEELAEFTRQHLRYQIEEGVWTDAYLLIPKGLPDQKRPGVVVFHQTVATNAAQVAGLDDSVPELMQGVQLVRRGYLVLCPRCFIFADGTDYAGNVTLMQQRHPDWTGMGRMTWDAIRAADLMLSRPDLDPARLGAIGHSLGAKEALYAAAFDERYRAVVFNEGGIGLGFSNWEAPWYLGPTIRQPGLGVDHHQLVALIAPRAFLLLAGGEADPESSRAYLLAALPVYRLYSAKPALGWLNHRTGHRYPPAAQAAAEAFLDAQLGGAPNSPP